MARLRPLFGSILRADRSVPPALVVTLCACIVVGIISAVVAAATPIPFSATEIPRVSVVSAELLAPEGATAALDLTVDNVGPVTVSVASQIDTAQGWLRLTAPTPDVIKSGQTAPGVFPVGVLEHFDGHPGAVTVANSQSLNPRAFTVEFAFQYSSLSPDQQQLIGKGNQTGNSFYFYSYRSVDNVNDFVIYENGTRFDQQLGDIFSPEVWYDLAVTVSGSSVDAYVDGVLVASWTHSVLFLGNTAPLILGECGCGGYFFNGSFSYVFVYNRALTTPEVASNYASPWNPLTSGMVLWYDFLPSANGTIPDHSGLGNYGVPSGNSTSISPVVPGQSYLVVVSATSPSGTIFSTTLSLRAEQS